MEPIDSEKLLPLEAARVLDWLPHPISFSTIWGWTQREQRGVKLEFRRVGGVMCTSEGALRRYFAALSEAPAKEGTGRGRKSAIDRANAFLDAKGIKK